jgi:lysylphosphatidylglycerol synthetase-like protein (DUF2156 family)
LSTQLKFELSQRLNHIGLEQRRRRRIAFHLAIRHPPELIDHLIERSGIVRAPLASQILSFTQPLAYLSRKLTRITVTLSATHHCIQVRSAAHPVAVRLITTPLRATGLLVTLLLTILLSTTLRSLLALLSFLTLLSLLLTLLLSLLLALLIALLLLLTVAIAPVRPFIQTTPQ